MAGSNFGGTDSGTSAASTKLGNIQPHAKTAMPGPENLERGLFIGLPEKHPNGVEVRRKNTAALGRRDLADRLARVHWLARAMHFCFLITGVLWLLLSTTVHADEPRKSKSEAEATAVEKAAPDWWDIEVAGTTRKVMVFVPKTATEIPAPLVFVFHGHGGTAPHAARTFGIQRLWPEAIVVYMQGLPTPGRLTDPEGKKAGWQRAAGDQEDRDLKFFDAVLARMQKTYKVDAKRVYSTGHSNGGAFTYLLWETRPDLFAAFAPSASAAGASVRKLKPKPALHIAGTKDPLVRFAWQERTMVIIRKTNGCSDESRPWADEVKLYPSATGTPFAEFVHSGGHEFHDRAPELIVKFFKEYPASK
jgi:polyhydroxybutyrate depolymerase